MIWPNQAKSAFNLGFDLDGETIWRNKARRLPGGDSFLKGPSSEAMVRERAHTESWRF